MINDSRETSALLELAAQGDESAIDRLFSRHLAKVRGFLRKRISRRLSARFDASDVLNEAHWEARQRLVDYLARRPMPFATWFLRTAYQRLIDAQRRHLRTAGRSVSRDVSLPEGSSWLEEVTGHRATLSAPDRLAVQQEQRQILHDCLQQLPIDDRRIIELRIFETQSNEQVADTLQITLATAKKRFTRALIKLKRLMPREDAK